MLTSRFCIEIKKAHIQYADICVNVTATLAFQERRAADKAGHCQQSRKQKRMHSCTDTDVGAGLYTILAL